MITTKHTEGTRVMTSLCDKGAQLSVVEDKGKLHCTEAHLDTISLIIFFILHQGH